MEAPFVGLVLVPPAVAWLECQDARGAQRRLVGAAFGMGVVCIAPAGGFLGVLATYVLSLPVTLLTLSPPSASTLDRVAELMALLGAGASAAFLGRARSGALHGLVVLGLAALAAVFVAAVPVGGGPTTDLFGLRPAVLGAALTGGALGGAALLWARPARRGGRDRSGAELAREPRPRSSSELRWLPSSTRRRCPICRDPLAPADEALVVTCAACDTAHHRECERDHGGCAVLGCARFPRRLRASA